MGDKIETLAPVLAAKRAAGQQVTPELLQRMREAGLLAPGNHAEFEAKLKDAGLLAPPAPPAKESKSYSYRVTQRTWREEASRFCEPGETYTASAPHFSSALEPLDEETRIATEGEKKRLHEHRKKFEKPAHSVADVEAIVQATLASAKLKEAESAARIKELETDLEKATAPAKDESKTDKGKNKS